MFESNVVICVDSMQDNINQRREIQEEAKGLIRYPNRIVFYDNNHAIPVDHSFRCIKEELKVEAELENENFIFDSISIFKEEFDAPAAKKNKLNNLIQDLRERLENIGVLHFLKEEELVFLNDLNEGQFDVFCDILSALKEDLTKGNFFIIDAAPGVGKTYLISTFMKVVIKKCFYIAPTHSLVIHAQSNGIASSTVCKFFLTLFSTDFQGCASMMNDFNNNPELSLAVETLKEQLNAISFSVLDFDILFVDEYVTLDVFYILSLLYLGEKYKISIIFLGDRFQQDAVKKNIHQKFNNYYFLKSFCTEFTLTQQMRVQDEELSRCLNIIKTSIQPEQDKNIISSLFCSEFLPLIPLNVFLNEIKFDSLYLSYRLYSVKQRIEKFEIELESNQIPFYRSYFIAVDGENGLKSLEYEHVPDHCVYLLLVVGCEYLFIENEKRQCVIFEWYDYRNDKIWVYSSETKQRFQIKRSKILYPVFHKTLLKYLNEKIPDFKGYILQFPLLQTFTSTTYAVQGLTIKKDTSIEINFSDMRFLNNLYVSMSRVTSFRQINKIIIEPHKLVSALFTKFSADDYVYKVPKYDRTYKWRFECKKIKFLLDEIAKGNCVEISSKLISNLIENKLQFKIAETVDEFENDSSNFIAILKDKFPKCEEAQVEERKLVDIVNEIIFQSDQN